MLRISFPVSLTSSNFKTIFWVELYQLKELYLPVDLNDEHFLHVTNEKPFQKQLQRKVFYQLEELCLLLDPDNECAG